MKSFAVACLLATVASEDTWEQCPEETTITIYSNSDCATKDEAATNNAASIY